MYDATEAAQIAKTIQAQIGLQYVPMIGAYNQFHHAEGALSFRFKVKAAKVNGKSPNWIKISLAPDDTYTVEYGRIFGHGFDILETETGIYCDQLRNRLEDTLQLALHVGMVFA